MAKLDFVRRKNVDTSFLKPSEILVSTKSKQEFYFMCVCICTIQYWFRRYKKVTGIITFSKVLKSATDDIEDCSKDITHKKDYPLTPWK